MESITRFITIRLKLKVNQQKSAAARPWERKFLGFSFTNAGEPKRRIAPKAVDRFQERVRELTQRTRGVSTARMAEELSRYLRGWIGYFESAARSPIGRANAFPLYQNHMKTLSETSDGAIRRAKSRFPRLLERLRKRETVRTVWQGTLGAQGRRGPDVHSNEDAPGRRQRRNEVIIAGGAWMVCGKTLDESRVTAYAVVGLR